MPEEALWPDEALARQAGRIGPAVLELIDAEKRWVYRRVERIELPNAAQATRSIAADISVPMTLATRLRLYAVPPDEGKEAGPTVASRLVVPLGTLPKAPLEDFSVPPADAQRLTAEQTKPLIVSALAPFARKCGADAQTVLNLLAMIVRSEEPATESHAQLKQLLQAAEDQGSGTPPPGSA